MQESDLPPQERAWLWQPGRTWGRIGVAIFLVSLFFTASGSLLPFAGCAVGIIIFGIGLRKRDNRRKLLAQKYGPFQRRQRY